MPWQQSVSFLLNRLFGMCWFVWICGIMKLLTGCDKLFRHFLQLASVDLLGPWLYLYSQKVCFDYCSRSFIFCRFLFCLCLGTLIISIVRHILLCKFNFLILWGVCPRYGLKVLSKASDMRGVVVKLSFVVKNIWRT